MKVIERLELIEKIGRELQARMTFSDIDVYLKGHGVDINKKTSGANSKRVYVKELLAHAGVEAIANLAEELKIAHDNSTASLASVASFWLPSHFKLFLSHLSSFKKNTGMLQTALKQFGISGFVAHVDIEPTKEWLDEIEAGLFSMDALAAIIMPGYKESDWTDQEVGVAVGRGVLIIPIIKGLLPYGFISKYQGLKVDGKNISQVAESIFKILVASPKTRTKMLDCLIATTLQSHTVEEAIMKLGHIESVKELPEAYLLRLRDAAPASVVLSDGEALTKLNKILSKYKLSPVKSSSIWDEFEDDIPF